MGRGWRVNGMLDSEGLALEWSHDKAHNLKNS